MAGHHEAGRMREAAQLLPPEPDTCFVTSVCDVASADPGPPVVVVALADRDRAVGLSDMLSSLGFRFVVAPGIRDVDRMVDHDDRFLAIIGDGSAGWLRDASDLARTHPNGRQLALIEIETESELLAALNAGISGFVSPSADLDAIARTVRAMLEGGVAVPRRLVSALVEDVRRGGRSVVTAVGAVEVTDREWEISQLLLQRRSTQEIADLLFVSVGTVRTHVSSLGRKVGANDREDIIRRLEW